jgi:choline-sulfatase
MISGFLPSNNGVLFNFNSISSDQATFLHSLNVSGYDTVLCGRMHFVGPDQRHGYSKRLAGDRTPVFHNGVKASPHTL